MTLFNQSIYRFFACRLWRILLFASLISASSFGGDKVLLRSPISMEMPKIACSKSDRACSVRINCPSRLSFVVSRFFGSDVFEYEAALLVEEVFQQAATNRWKPGAGANSDGSFDVNVHKIIVDAGSDSAECSAEILCVIRDSDRQIVYKKLYTSSARSAFDESQVPPAVINAVADIARRCVSDAVDDPVVGRSSLGGVSGDDERDTVAVLNFSTKAAKGISNELGDALSEYLRVLMVKSGRYRLMAREEVDRALAEYDMPSFIQEDSIEIAVEYAEVLEVQKIVVATISNVGSSYLVTVKLVDVDLANPRVTAAGKAYGKGGREEIFTLVERAAKDMLR
jgi:hypothetical protein